MFTVQQKSHTKNTHAPTRSHWVSGPRLQHLLRVRRCWYVGMCMGKRTHHASLHLMCLLVRGISGQCVAHVQVYIPPVVWHTLTHTCTHRSLQLTTIDSCGWHKWCARRTAKTCGSPVDVWTLPSMYRNPSRCARNKHTREKTHRTDKRN